MMAELAERDATGEIAGIYAEIRRLWAVPYVSSLQRHLATRPGWLEWAWAAVGPAFVGGRAQTAAWRATDKADVPRLRGISRDALSVLGVDEDAQSAIRATCACFVRASPVNLVFSSLLRRLLNGERPSGAAGPGHWTPPPSPAALPPLADPASLPAPERAVLETLGTAVDGRVFVPGLYRMLARWPAFLAHAATALGPHLGGAATAAACERVLRAVDAEIPAVFAALPPVAATPPMPPAREYPAVLAALDTYRKTSPEMVVFGRMLRDALPADGAA